MSRHDELEEKFYEKYERPVIEPYTLVFSGIDPPLKAGTGILSSHELLEGLLGGDISGHYHLTGEEYEKLVGILEPEPFEERYPPEIYSGQEVPTTANEEMTPYEVQGENVRQGE